MKRMDIKAHVALAKSRANFQQPSHLNYSGGFAPMRRNFVAQPAFQNATGAAAMSSPGGAVKRSMPYIINITNGSTAAQSNVDVLGANQYLFNTGLQANGDLVIGSITISSGVPNISYRDLLATSQTNPFTVGQTYISSQATPAQVQEVFTVTTKDPNGSLLQVPISPAIDPYQQQSGILVDDTPYRIDGNTKLTISQVLGSAVVQVRFFPADNINPGRALAGQPVGQSFADPGLIR